MLGHLSFGVANLEQSIRFYDAAFAPLGYCRLWRTERAAGYGSPGGNDRLALFACGSDASPPGPGFHLAFVAPDRAAVDGFHKAALAAGGSDAGPPGLRDHYGPSYYAAFVKDLDGYKLEAVHQ